MDKKTRKAVLYGLFGLFFVLGAGAILYAQGYRFDLGTFGVQKVGAIYIRTYPKNASVLVDGKAVDRGAMILSSGTLVPDLFPKPHEVTVESAGFITWKRSVSVNPSLVAEVQAILLPEKPELVRGIVPLEFWALPDTPLVEFLPGLNYSGYKIPGSFSEFNSDKTQVLTRDASKNYYVTNLSSATTTMKSQKLTNITGGKISFDKTPGQFISYNKTTAALLTLGGVPAPVFTAPKGQTIIGADASKNLLALVTVNNQNQSLFWLYEKLSGNIKKFDPLQGRTVDLKFSPNGQVALLQDNGDLYLYDPSSANISKTSSDVKSFSFSENGTLAILSDRILEIYADGVYSRLNLAFLPDIKNTFWYSDGEHLFLQFSDHLGLLDLIDFQPENVQFINNSTKNSYDQISNTLYFEKDAGLYRIIFLS